VLTLHYSPFFLFLPSIVYFHLIFLITFTSFTSQLIDVDFLFYSNFIDYRIYFTTVWIFYMSVKWLIGLMNIHRWEKKEKSNRNFLFSIPNAICTYVHDHDTSRRLNIRRQSVLACHLRHSHIDIILVEKYVDVCFVSEN
jgi:hypothetical protein